MIKSLIAFILYTVWLVLTRRLAIRIVGELKCPCGKYHVHGLAKHELGTSVVTVSRKEAWQEVLATLIHEVYHAIQSQTGDVNPFVLGPVSRPLEQYCASFAWQYPSERRLGEYWAELVSRQFVAILCGHAYIKGLKPVELPADFKPHTCNTLGNSGVYAKLKGADKPAMNKKNWIDSILNAVADFFAGLAGRSDDSVTNDEPEITDMDSDGMVITDTAPPVGNYPTCPTKEQFIAKGGRIDAKRLPDVRVFHFWLKSGLQQSTKKDSKWQFYGFRGGTAAMLSTTMKLEAAICGIDGKRDVAYNGENLWHGERLSVATMYFVNGREIFKMIGKLSKKLGLEPQVVVLGYPTVSGKPTKEYDRNGKKVEALVYNLHVLAYGFTWNGRDALWFPAGSDGTPLTGTAVTGADYGEVDAASYIANAFAKTKPVTNAANAEQATPDVNTAFTKAVDGLVSAAANDEQNTTGARVGEIAGDEEDDDDDLA